MKIQKYLIFITLSLLLLTPFILLAQKIDNQIGPSKFRADHIVSAAIVLPGGDNNAKNKIGTVEDLIINNLGQVTHVVANLDKNNNWNWWNGKGLYLLPSSVFSDTTIGNNKLALQINQVTDANIPQAQSRSAIPGMIESNSVEYTNLKQFEVVGMDNRKLGSVQDVVVDMAQKEAVYVAVSESGNKHYAIPFSAFKFDVTQKRIDLNMTKQQFDSHPSFNPKSWPENATF